MCIPVQLSESLIKIPNATICQNFKDHFCNFLSKYSFDRNAWDTCREKSEIDKSYVGQIFIDSLKTPVMNDKTKRVLIKMFWWMKNNNYKTITEESLVHDPKYLLSNLGGTLSLFIGYSLFDILVKILDHLFEYFPLQKFTTFFAKKY